MKRSIVVRAVLSVFVIGVAFGLFWRGDEKMFWLSLVLSVIFFVVGVQRGGAWFLASMLVLVFCFGGIWTRVSEPVMNASHIAFYNSQIATIRGWVSEEPERRKTSARYIIQVESLGKNGEQPVHGRLQVIDHPFPARKYGEGMVLKCKLEKPRPIEGFAYDEYLARYDIYSVCAFPDITLTGVERGNAVLGSLFRFKVFFLERLGEVLSPTPSALVAGLLTGDRSGFTDDLKSQFSQAGLTHILAVSGYNITIIGWMVYWMCGRLWMNRRQAFAVACIVILGFVVIAGFESSVLRAAMMGLLILFAEQIGRRKSGLTLLLLAAVAMLLWNPKVLFADVGFQLSFLATFGLLEIAPRLERFFQWFPNTFELRTIVVTTLSAQLMTLPVLVSTFHVVSLVAPITNLLVLPLVPLTMLAGALTGLVGMISVPLGSVVAFFALFPIWYELFVVSLFSRLPFAAIVLEISPWIVWSVFIVLIFLFFQKDLKLVFLANKNPDQK